MTGAMPSASHLSGAGFAPTSTPASGSTLRSRDTDLMVAALRGLGIDVVDCDDLEQAVRLGREWAGQGGVVLLSPAAPSFGRYADYRARAAAFAVAAGLTITEVDT